MTPSLAKTEPIKVYPGLTSVDRTATYHLGFYEISFQDGPLTFELFARICGDTQCLCDTLAIDWHTQGRVTSTWYTADHGWFDQNRKPLNPELAEVFQIVEELETFQERYSHLVFLRRQMVLRELQREQSPFEVRLQPDLIGPEANPQQHTLGVVRLGSKNSPPKGYAIEFCADEACYCTNLILAVLEKDKPTLLCIDPEDHWSAMDGTSLSKELAKNVRAKLKKDPFFAKQVTFFRTERMLQNYHRYVTKYLATHRVGV